MRKLTALIVFSIFMLSMSTFFAYKPSSAAVSGILTSDTSWTTAQSPIHLTGSVCVNSGITLRIEPGVTVDLGDYNILVNGTLIARGTSSSKINFIDSTLSDNAPNRQPQIKFASDSKDWNEALGTGCIVENANFDVVTIKIDECSPLIRGNSFRNSTTTVINALSGSSIIENNDFTSTGLYLGNGHGVSIGGSTVFRSNILSNIGYTHPISCSGNAIVSNNHVSESYCGIFAADSVQIQGNSLINNKAFGIDSHGNTTIVGNFIANDTIGIKGNGYIRDNTITGNLIGIESPASTITGNNIYGNSKNSVHMSGADDIDATNNWWGTSDTESISHTIWDFNDDFDLGKVNFQPILTNPSPSAPTNGDIDSTIDQEPVPNDDTSFVLDNQVQAYILTTLQIAIVGLGVAWATVLVIFVTRHRRK